jgi:DNA-binding response OmpR family regulator
MLDKVLIIDDDERLVSALQMRLSTVGYAVHTAHNGDIGLSQAALFQPEAIILDIRMPEMDGHEVCRIMRTVPELQHIPIIILSASVEDHVTQTILEAGGNLFLRKPYYFPQLLFVLGEAIQEVRLSQQNAARTGELMKYSA